MKLFKTTRWFRWQSSCNPNRIVLCPIALVLRSSRANYRQLCNGSDLEHINARKLGSLQSWPCFTTYCHETIHGNFHRRCSGMTLAVVLLMAFIMKKNNTAMSDVWPWHPLSSTLTNLSFSGSQSF